MYIVGIKSPLGRINQRSKSIYNLTDKELFFKGNLHKVINTDTMFLTYKDKLCFYGSVEEAKKFVAQQRKRYIIILCEKPNSEDLEHLLRFGSVFHNEHLLSIKDNTIKDENTFIEYDINECSTNLERQQQPKKQDVSKPIEK